MKIINFKKKKMNLLTNELQKSNENAKICYICKEKFENKYLKDKKCRKVRDHCHYTSLYIAFTVPIDKEVKRLDKNGEETAKNISDILQFIDSARFMASSLSNLISNLSEGIHQIICIEGHNDEKCETCGITYEVCGCFLQ